MPIGKNKTRFAVTLEMSTAQSVAELAEIEKRSVSAMMAILVTEALDSRKKINSFVRGADYYKNILNNAHNTKENHDG